MTLLIMLHHHHPHLVDSHTVQAEGGGPLAVIQLSYDSAIEQQPKGQRVMKEE